LLQPIIVYSIKKKCFILTEYASRRFMFHDRSIPVKGCDKGNIF